MSIRLIDVGEEANDETGDTLRDGGIIINENFAELDTRTAAAQTKAEQGVADAAAAKAKADAAVPSAALGVSVAQLVSGKVPVPQLPEFVEPVAGKGLSSNDFTTPEKTKLASMVNAASYGVGAPAPFLDNIYQVKDGGITYWNQSTTGRPPEGGQGNLISMTGGNNGSASTFIATSLNEDKVFFGRVNGATRPPWKQFLLAGDFGVGAKDNAPWQGENLNPDTFRTGGTFLGQFNITGSGTPGYALTGFLTVFGGTNSSICSQTFQSADLGLIYSRSQSGGVWKAWERAFVETITNANGTATKFPDGTLICRWTASARDSASNPQGQLFISTARFQTFAVPFVGETPTVSPASSDPNNAHCWGVVTSAGELTRVQVAVMSAASNGQARPGYIAVGRWR
ncbi:pyocin knob domain-containing protein [Pseudomonas sp. MWU349]|uniref:pyocin knob domain-containing protein n=1 Tax=Pseudomonas sp. MWU349 TaxID=2802572 RepID=UPI001B320E22|nr:pyocin knob domain-containing protein [Pseudomonas sp. MWU349]